MSSRINERKKREKIRTIINDTASKHAIQRISQSKKRRVLKKRERRQPLSGTQKGILVQVYRYLRETKYYKCLNLKFL